MANILVTGANGQLGRALRRKSFSFLDEVFYTAIEELDVTDYDAIEKFVVSHEIDTIINCAAYTAVDLAENESEKAERINTKAVENLAKVARKEDCLLIHISTDYVFDGLSTVPYTEKDTPAPKTVYGKTKWAGEQAIMKSGCWYIIIRTAWLYSCQGNNFVKTILHLADERSEINVVNDQFGSPTYAEDLADAIIAIMNNEERIEHEGIYHFSGEGECSWYDFALQIVAMAHKNCKINPVTTAEYPTKAMRPAYSVLDNTKIKKVFGIKIPDWKESLCRMLQESE